MTDTTPQPKNQDHCPHCGAVGRCTMPNLDSYTGRQRDKMYKRLSCINEFREAKSWTGNQREWMSHLIRQLRIEHPNMKISESSLRRWDSLYKCVGCLEQLIDKRGGDRVSRAFNLKRRFNAHYAALKSESLEKLQTINP